eukprot:5529761-Prymnesium_polylepis.1
MATGRETATRPASAGRCPTRSAAGAAWARRGVGASGLGGRARARRCTGRTPRARRAACRRA